MRCPAAGFSARWSWWLAFVQVRFHNQQPVPRTIYIEIKLPRWVIRKASSSAINWLGSSSAVGFSRTPAFPRILGGHLKTGHTWTLQNRPTKWRKSGQDLLYLVMLNSANIFCSGIDIWAYTIWAGAEGRATQGCDLSADSGPDHTVPGMSSRYPRIKNGLAGCAKSREREGWPSQ